MAEQSTLGVPQAATSSPYQPSRSEINLNSRIRTPFGQINMGKEFGEKKALTSAVQRSRPDFGTRVREILRLRQEKRDAPGKIQQSITRSGLENASRFQENLPQYIAQEASHLRKGISQKLADTTGQIRGGANSRGMLFSGRRMADEGKAAQMAGAEYAAGLGGIVSGANEQALGMMADPLASMANINESRDAASSYLDRASQARNDATNALRNNYIGMIGSGIGEYAGGKSDPNKTPRNQVLGANNYNTGTYT